MIRDCRSKPGGSRQSNWVFARVSVITNGNKAPGGFGNHVFGTKQAKLFAFGDQTPAPACFGNLAEKSGASGAFRGLLFLQSRAAPVRSLFVTPEGLKRAAHWSARVLGIRRQMSRAHTPKNGVLELGALSGRRRSPLLHGGPPHGLRHGGRSGRGRGC